MVKVMWISIDKKQYQDSSQMGICYGTIIIETLLRQDFFGSYIYGYNCAN